MSTAKKANGDRTVEYTYTGVKVFKQRFTRFKDHFTTIKEFNELIDEWKHYIDITSDDIKSVPLIMLEIESIDDVIDSIIIMLKPNN